MADPTPNEPIGGLLQGLITNGGLTNQLLGQIVAAISNQGTIAATGEISSSSPTAGVGYTTGAGGTVTQATSKSTGVTINKVTGAITMNNAALLNATNVSFTVTNSAIAAADLVMVNHSAGGTAGGYSIQANAIAAGSFQITVRNISGGSLSEAIVLSFAIIRGATA